MTNNDGYVLLIGAAGIDIKAQPYADVHWERDNIGQVRNSVGGVARNIAENLARLEVPTVLLSAVGRDPLGARVLKATRDAGTDVRHVRRVIGEATGNFVALLRPGGDLHVAVSDFSVLRHVNRPYLEKHEPLFQGASLIVIDLNLSEEAIETIFELAGRFNVRVAVDPTSPALSVRVKPYLNHVYLVTPNAVETEVMCGDVFQTHDHDSAISAAHKLAALGAEIAIVTLGDQGAAYADGRGGGYVGALHTNVVDTTGAGDAFTGAVIFGLLNGVTVDEAMRLGVTAASLTLGSRETVVPDLTQELLYARLVV